MKFLVPIALAAAAALAPVSASATTVITVTIENLAQENSIAVAPLRVAFNSGVYDAFNFGEAATAPIISIAEGGSGSDWFPAFAAADPTATLGSVGGVLLPGAMASETFMVDGAVNPFFTFAAMVLPSNDYFIGNDDPQEYRLFDENGNLNLTSITLTASDIWNAGSEETDPANAAFLVGGTNANRTPEGGAVEFDFEGLTSFNGLETAAGYRFDANLDPITPIYRISFSAAPAVPEPATWAMLLVGIGFVGGTLRRRSGLQDQGHIVAA